MVNNAASGQSGSSGVVGHNVTDEQMQRAYSALGLSFTPPNTQGRPQAPPSGKLYAKRSLECQNNIIL